MIKKYPIKFTLDGGTHVEVNQTAAGIYNFTLIPTKGAPRQFTYTDNDRTNPEMEEALDFDQLNAVRTFWLKEE